MKALNRVLDCVFSFVVLDICTDLQPFSCDVISRGIPDYTVQLNNCWRTVSYKSGLAIRFVNHLYFNVGQCNLQHKIRSKEMVTTTSKSTSLDFRS